MKAGFLVHVQLPPELVRTFAPHELLDAVAVRQWLPGGALLAALHEGGSVRELYFEDYDAAREFAVRRRVTLEWPEQPRQYRAVDYMH